MEEFRLILTQLAAGETEATGAIAGPSILVVTGGEGKMAVEGKTLDLKEGFVYFVGCGVEVRYESSSHGLQVHRAYCEA
jgi:mannose-6-phosphate isomerase